MHPEFGIGPLTLIGTGLDAAVFRAESTTFDDVAVRVPWTRFISNQNDPQQDARELLIREQLLNNHMREHGVPAPRALALHLGDDDFDFLVSVYVPDDGSVGRPDALGALLRAIHGVPVTDDIVRALTLGPGCGSDVATTLAGRVVKRLRVVRELSGKSLPAFSITALRAIVAGASYRPSVLHLDARRANLRVVDGEIQAILDWSNALLADPALELARVAEYGARDAAFDAGYGPLPTAPRALDVLYRLDTAVMLAVVFLSEAPDPVLARRQVARVEELIVELGVCTDIETAAVESDKA